MALSINKTVMASLQINKSAIGWGFNRVKKVFGNLLALCIQCVLPVKKGRVVCWAYNFNQYSCNPRYLTEYILEHNPEFEVYWVFRHSLDVSGIDKRVKYVRRRTWKYYVLMNTAEFLISNVRADSWKLYWRKRAKQKYLMVWHGGVALKRIEADAEKQLSYSYVKKAKLDSRNCDLMISGSRIQTELTKRAYWYNGEVLEKGTPRNDIFFKTALHRQIRETVCKLYNIPTENRIVLYAPTFRRGLSTDPYIINWKRVINHLSSLFDNQAVTLLVRLHPNLIHKAGTLPFIDGTNVIDTTRYHDMQELLCISDMLITDYSSSMFDYTILRRPCLLYAPDAELYDRGFYFDLEKDLPYPLARTEQQLVDVIDKFDQATYEKELDKFLTERIGLIEDGNACKALTEWMLAHSIDK